MKVWTDLRTLYRVQHIQALVEGVEPVVGIGLLKAQVQVHLGARLHLLERLLKLARLEHGHHLAVEGQPVTGIQVQDPIAHLPDIRYCRPKTI